MARTKKTKAKVSKPKKIKDEQPQLFKVNVRFTDNDYSSSYGTVYSYLSDTDVSGQSHVIVDSPRNGLTIVKVVSVAPYDGTGKATKYIYGTITPSKDALRAQNEAKIAELRKQIKARLTEVNEMALLESLAKKDSTARSLMKQIKELENAV